MVFGWMSNVTGLSLGGTLASILALSHVEGALQIGIAMRVLFDIRHIHPLGHINRLVRMRSGSNPVDHREQIP
jgi:hypothetical protein